MKIERPGLIQFAGQAQTVIGADVYVGQKAPDFVALRNEMWDFVFLM
ncbi:MAG: hypothetical protein ACUVRJ_01740 [Candidatus Villigracilaceae bacterium]